MSGPCLCQGDDCYGEISSLEETFLRLANSPPRSPALLVDGVLPGIGSSVDQSNCGYGNAVDTSGCMVRESPRLAAGG